MPKPKPRIAYIDQVIHWAKDEFAFNPMADSPNRIKYADGKPFNCFRDPAESLKCCKAIVDLIAELKPEKPIEDALLFQMSFIISTAKLAVEDELGDVEGWQAIVQWKEDRDILKRFEGKLTEDIFNATQSKADFFTAIADGINDKTTPVALYKAIKKGYPENSPSGYWALQVERMKRYKELTDHPASDWFTDEYKRLLAATQAIEKTGVGLGLDFGKGL